MIKIVYKFTEEEDRENYRRLQEALKDVDMTIPIKDISDAIDKQITEEIIKDKEVDLIFKFINELLWDGRYQEVDFILELATEVKSWDTTKSLALLSLTFPAKTLLKNYDSYLLSVRKRFETNSDTKDRIEDLLKGWL